MPIYALTILVSAFLLFQVEPVIAKIILPWFGGSAAVWTACLVFFQVALLAGYLYAHALVRYLKPRAQTAVHLGLLAVSALTLAVYPSASLQPYGAGDPTWSILLLLGRIRSWLLRSGSISEYAVISPRAISSCIIISSGLGRSSEPTRKSVETFKARAREASFCDLS